MRSALRVVNFLFWAGLWWLISSNNGQTTDPFRFFEQAIIPILVFIYFDYSLRGRKQKDEADIVTRIESIEAERAELASDVKDILAEAKSAGFDLRAIRQIVRLRRQDKDERNARQAVVDEYLEALGDYASTSLGKAAMERAGSPLMPPV